MTFYQKKLHFRIRKDLETEQQWFTFQGLFRKQKQYKNISTSSTFEYKR